MRFVRSRSYAAVMCPFLLAAVSGGFPGGCGSACGGGGGGSDGGTDAGTPSGSSTPLPYLDGFEPSFPAPLQETPRSSDGTYALPLGGAFSFESQSYCLDSNTAPPGSADAYLWGALDGWAAPLVQPVLRGSALYTDIAADDVQLLLWGITSCDAFANLNESTQAAAKRLLTADQLAAMDRNASSCPTGPAVASAPTSSLQPVATRPGTALAARTVPAPNRAALHDAIRRRDLRAAERAVFGRSSGTKVSRSALTAATAPGQWAYASDGYFIRIVPDSYRLTRVTLYSPETYQVTRDAKGRISALTVGSTGERIETDYDDSVAPLEIPGDTSVRGFAFSAVQSTYRDRSRPDVLRHAQQQATGWVLVGIPSGTGTPAADSGRYADAAARYQLASSLLPQVPTGAADLIDLASYAAGVRAVLGEPTHEIARRGWMSTYGSRPTTLSATSAATGSSRRFNPAGGSGRPSGGGTQPLGVSGRSSAGAPMDLGYKKLRQLQKTYNSMNEVIDFVSNPEKGAMKWWLGQFYGALGKLGIPSSPWMLFDHFIGMDFELAKGIHEQLAQDPPRSDYTVIAVPAALTLPTVPVLTGADPARVAEGNALLAAIAQYVARLQAAQVTLDRLGGALQANDATWAGRQLRALLEFKRQAGVSMLDMADHIDRLLVIIAASGDPDVSVTEADVTRWQQSLATVGLSQDMMDAGAQLGMNAAALAALRQSFLAEDPSTVAGTLSSAVGDLRDALREMGDSWAALPGSDLSALP